MAKPTLETFISSIMKLIGFRKEDVKPKLPKKITSDAAFLAASAMFSGTSAKRKPFKSLKVCQCGKGYNHRGFRCKSCHAKEIDNEKR